MKKWKLFGRVAACEAALHHQSPPSSQNVHTYLAGRNPAAARRVAGDIRKAADRLRDFPFIGRQGEVAGTREWILRGTPYLIIYEVREAQEELLVLGVFHGAQDWQSDLR